MVDVGALLVIEHVAMVLSTLASMLLRREEYSRGVHAGRPARSRRACGPVESAV